MSPAPDPAEPAAPGQRASALAPAEAAHADNDIADAPWLRTMRVVDLDEVTAIESRAYPFPWSRGNFIDSLAAGYLARVLVAVGEAEASQGPSRVTQRSTPPAALIGYYLAMHGVEEMHLLNITVAPEHEHRGHARRMLSHLMAASREAGARSLWLEVRESNLRARCLYERWGFAPVGLRKGYYPAAQGQREHAIVMSLPLGADAEGHDALE